MTVDRGTERCLSGCGCDDFMSCDCADCAVSPTFDVEGMDRFHEELVNVGITGRSPEEEARIFDAVRLVSARHGELPR